MKNFNVGDNAQINEMPEHRKYLDGQTVNIISIVGNYKKNRIMVKTKSGFVLSVREDQLKNISQ